jgi:hypothetical protein
MSISFRPLGDAASPRPRPRRPDFRMPGVRAIESRSPAGLATSPLSYGASISSALRSSSRLTTRWRSGPSISKVAGGMSELWTYWLPGSLPGHLYRALRRVDRIGHEQLAPFRDATEIEAKVSAGGNVRSLDLGMFGCRDCQRVPPHRSGPARRRLHAQPAPFRDVLASSVAGRKVPEARVPSVGRWCVLSSGLAT